MPVAALAGAGDVCGDDYSGKECQSSTDQCAAANPTEVGVQLGGEGSIGSEDNCSDSPARDKSGAVVEGILTFHWQYASDTQGTLTLTAYNDTCDHSATNPSESSIMDVWFNTPAAIAGCTLTSATLENPVGATPVNVCDDDVCPGGIAKGWTLGRDNGSGCVGGFDHQLDKTGQPNQYGALPGGHLVFVMTCTGSGLDEVTACDIANEGSAGEPGERTAQAALHFQQSDSTNEESLKVSSNCQQDLFVNLASFVAAPTNGGTFLEWETLAEIDNAGFYLLRRDMVSGEVARLNDGLIPAAGDLIEGAYYHFLDDTAVNGVEYEYVLVDVELDGDEAYHPSVVAVANPVDPPVRLAFPRYGSADLRQGEWPSFAWRPTPSERMALVISADPTFQEGTMLVGLNRRNQQDGQVTLTPRQARRMERMARDNHSVVYWAVARSDIGGDALSASETFRVGYRHLEKDASGNRVVRGGGVFPGKDLRQQRTRGSR